MTEEGRDRVGNPDGTLVYWQAEAEAARAEAERLKAERDELRRRVRAVCALQPYRVPRHGRARMAYGDRLVLDAADVRALLTDTPSTSVVDDG